MKKSQLARSHQRLRLPRALSVFFVLYVATALGCGEGGSSNSDSGVATVSATQARDVEFGRAAITIVDNSFSFCPFVGTTLSFQATGPAATLGSLYANSALSTDGQSTNFATGLGGLRAAPGEEVCATVTGRNWDSTEVCYVIEPGTNQLTFSLEMSRPAGCIFEIELEASVQTFDSMDFCTASCSHLRSCGRPDDGCVATCIEDLADASDPNDEICFDATRTWLSCLHTAPCINEPEFFCENFNSGFSAEAALFSSGQCARPFPPPPPRPDPLACDPRQSELVAGTVGDFFVVSATSDFPNRHYLLLDLRQLDEVDAVLAASPNDPLLSAARTILPTLRGLDGSLRDRCNEAGIVSIRFDIDPNLARSAYASIDNQLISLQANLASLGSLAAEAKRQAVAFVFDQIFCPVTFQVFSILPTPFGEIAGVTAQASLGCFN